MKSFIIMLALALFSFNSAASVGSNPNDYTLNIVYERFEKISDRLYEASEITGFDMGDLTAIASLESTLNTNAKSEHSSATALLQYTTGTWKQDFKEHREKLGLPKNAKRTDPRANLLVGAASLLAAKEFLIQTSHLTEDTIRVGDLYMSHFLGRDGAAKVINAKSNTPMNKLVAISKGNYSYFYKPNGKLRTAHEFRDYMNQLVVKERTHYVKVINKYQMTKVYDLKYKVNNGHVDDMAIATGIHNTSKFVGFNYNS